MNTLSRTISGTLLVVIGLFLMVFAPKAHFVTLIYGIPILILGFFILYNKREDSIEERKDLKGKKKGK